MSSNSPPLSSIFNFQYLALVSNCTNNSFNSRPAHFSHFRTFSVYMPTSQKKWLGVTLPGGINARTCHSNGLWSCLWGFANDLLSDLGQVAQPLWAVQQQWWLTSQGCWEETLINWLGNSQYRQLYKYLPIYNELTAYERQKICIITENPVWTQE